MTHLRSRFAELRQALANRLRSPAEQERRRREVFSTIYATGAWGSEESASGAGSTLAATSTLRGQIQELFEEYSIQSLLDAPCGDCHWMAELLPDLRLDRYVGVDIVEELILANRQRVLQPNVQFEMADLCRDELPTAQLALCRDCLIHLSLAEGKAALRNLARGTQWMLLSSDKGVTRNREIEAGSWRPVDLARGPFHLPEPVRWLPQRRWFEGSVAIESGLGLWPTNVVSVALS